MFPLLTSERLEYLSKYFLAALFSLFLFRFVRDFITTLWPGTLVMIVFEAIIVAAFLLRRPAKELSRSPWDWCVGMAGTWITLLFVPEPEGFRHPIALAGQLGGFIIAAIAMFDLGRSIGIVAANRGVQTGGLYRMIRHPVYFGYLIAHLALLIQNLSIFNTGIIGAYLMLMVLRIRAEERLLMRDPNYRTFAARTRYRLLWGIW